MHKDLPIKYKRLRKTLLIINIILIILLIITGIIKTIKYNKDGNMVLVAAFIFGPLGQAFLFSVVLVALNDIASFFRRGSNCKPDESMNIPWRISNFVFALVIPAHIIFLLFGIIQFINIIATP